MQNHLNQAKHNQKFHEALCSNFSDKFFDWKTTSLFYCSIHYLKALYSKWGEPLGTTHVEIDRQVNPHGKASGKKITLSAYRLYNILQVYSRTARYDGFVDHEDFMKMREADYNHALEVLGKFKLYIQSHGIKLEDEQVG